MRTIAFRILAAIFATIFILSCCTAAAIADTTTPVKRIGDVDGNGDVNAFDYMFVKRYCLRTYKPVNIDYEVWDVNRDNDINAIDYMMIKRHVLGTFRLPEYSIAEPPVENPPPSIPPVDPAPTTPVANPQPEMPDEYDPACVDMWNAVNHARVENGASELVYRWDLQEAADIRAKEIVEKFDHIRPDGRPPHSVIYDMGYTGFCGECLTMGTFDAYGAVRGWFTSTPHRNIILWSTMTGMICGHYFDGDRTNYWVLILVETPYKPKKK